MFAGKLWIVFALGSAILWGFGYALSEKVMKQNGISPEFLMVISGGIYLLLSIAIVTGSGRFQQEAQLLLENKTLCLQLFTLSSAYVAGTWMIYKATFLKNATLANLVEISYPVFTALFAYLILKDVQLNWATAFGGLLVLSGVGIIFLKS